MSETLVAAGVEYRLYTPKDEIDDFHSMVKTHYKRIFGATSLYFDIRKTLRSKSKIGSIPDVYILDFKRGEWYVVEEELSQHPVYDHIVNQLTRFLNGIKNLKSRNQLCEALYQEINKDDSLRSVVKNQTESRDIHHALTNLILKEPKIVVIIDEKTVEVEEAVESIPSQPILIEFRTYAQENNPESRAHLFEPIHEIVTRREHTPQRLSIEEFVNNVEMPIREVTRVLISRISQLNNVVFRGKTSYSAYIGKRRIIYGFAGIQPRKSTLKIYVRTNSPSFSDPKKWLEPQKVKWFTEYEENAFTITNENQVDYAMELINQSYQIIQKVFNSN